MAGAGERTASIGDDEGASVGCVGDDLEEVAANLFCGAVLSLDQKAGIDGAGLVKDDLLDHGGLLDVKRVLTVPTERNEHAPEEKDDEGL